MMVLIGLIHEPRPGDRHAPRPPRERFWHAMMMAGIWFMPVLGPDVVHEVLAGGSGRVDDAAIREPPDHRSIL